MTMYLRAAGVHPLRGLPDFGRQSGHPLQCLHPLPLYYQSEGNLLPNQCVISAPTAQMQCQFVPDRCVPERCVPLTMRPRIRNKYFQKIKLRSLVPLYSRFGLKEM
jgi:hypothetical protein